MAQPHPSATLQSFSLQRSFPNIKNENATDIAAAICIQNNHFSNILRENATQQVIIIMMTQTVAIIALKEAKNRPVFIHPSNMSLYSSCVYHVHSPTSKSVSREKNPNPRCSPGVISPVIRSMSWMRWNKHVLAAFIFITNPNTAITIPIME